MAETAAATPNKWQASELWNRKINRLLKSFDMDGDGIVTAEDFLISAVRFREMGVAPDKLEKLVASAGVVFELWGITEECKLTYDEFKTKHSTSFEKVGNFSKHALVFDAMFDIVDADDTGVISLQQWIIYNQANCVGPVDSKASFAAMDTDRDGKVSKEVFRAYVEEFCYSTEDKLNSSILYGALE